MIDLRSDTVTKPTAAMRAAMAAAIVGDDGYAEDPTVARLEALAAEKMGKEAGLLMPSGTMSNLVAALSHCPEDRRLTVFGNSHIGWTLTYNPRIAGLNHVTEVESTPRGLPDTDALLAALDDTSQPEVGLVCYENSYNLAGGTAIAPGEMAETVGLVRERGLPIHLDGARIFNAAVALEVPASELAGVADSVTFCLSKGLGAPVGSVLCGSAEFIERARFHRQYLGGTMRQAGVVAAAGLIALETMIERLAEDHAKARLLAEGLATIPGIDLLGTVETNIVLFDVAETGLTDEEMEAELNRNGVRMDGYSKDTTKRAVTHFDVSREDCERAVDVVSKISLEAKRTR